MQLSTLTSAGSYTFKLLSVDSDGHAVIALASRRVVDPDSINAAAGTPTHDLLTSTVSAQPGETVVIVWCTGAATGRAYVKRSRF